MTLIRGGSRALCGLAALMCVVALFAVPKAHASTADFCGTSSSPRGYPYGDRCAAGYHGAVGFTRFTVASDEGSNFMCALVKENADGGGGNRSAPACAYSTVQESDCTTAYNPCSGYATNTNAWTSIVGFAGWGYFEYSF